MAFVVVEMTGYMFRPPAGWRVLTRAATLADLEKWAAEEDVRRGFTGPPKPTPASEPDGADAAVIVEAKP